MMVIRQKGVKAGLKSILKFSPKEKAFLFLMVIVGALLLGTSGTQFSVLAGEGSDWGADVEILALGYNGKGYTRTSLPGNVLLNGPRIVTLDYDGDLDVSSLPLIEYENSGLTWDRPYADGNSAGMMPMVSHAVGNFFYASADGQKVLAPVRVYEETGADIGNVHYYYGFSVMFTTRVEAQTEYEYATVSIPGIVGTIDRANDNKEDVPLFGIATRAIPAVGSIEAMTQVGIKIESLTDSFEYSGSVNTITVVNERARYTLSEDISGVSSELGAFNLAYEWEEYRLFGKASGQTPRLVYDVVDSESENMATVELKADLSIGLDCFDIEAALGSTGEIQALENDGYAFVKYVNIYNVEYIYDVVVDISVNGVPISDWMGNWAQGTEDGTLPADEPEYGRDWMLIAVIVAIAFLGLAIIRKIL